MQLNYINPRELIPNPWNSNNVSPEGMERLYSSLKRHGFVKPVIVRERPDGVLEILGGQHRVEAAISMGFEEVPTLNLGEVSDARAKEIGLIDNARYGSDDANALADILKEIGKDVDVASFLPFTDAELAALATDLTVDDIDSLLGEDDGSKDEPEERAEKKPPTHTIMRFKVGREDEGIVRDLINDIMKEQNFTEEDELTNAGDALVFLAQTMKEVEDE